jgi:hypothetical protein
VAGALCLACNDPLPGGSDGGRREPRVEDSGVAPSTGTEASRDAGTPPGYVALFDDLDGPVLSAWGLDASHVFFVGEGGLVIERRGGSFLRHRVPTEESLWWVWGSALDDVLVGGEGGTLLHFDGRDWRTIDAGLDALETVWGIWGVGNRRFVVGGRARTNGPGFLVEGDGSGFQRVATLQQNLYKVWGRNAQEVYVVGGDSSLFAFADGALDEFDLGAFGENADPLFTVAGNASTVMAVGGITSGLAFEARGADFEAVPLETSGLNGVSVSAGGTVVVAGLFGTVRERNAAGWQDFDLFSERHYHAALAFDDGAYAVGGDLLRSGKGRRGLVIARGAARVDAAELEEPRNALDAGPAFDGSVPGAPGEREAGVAPHAPGDASVGRDAGVLDSGRAARDAETVRDAGSGWDGAGEALPGSGDPCGAEYSCAPGLECWYVQGLGELRCVPFCESASECPEEFGAAPQCAPPGCQTTLAVCLRAEWQGCALLP